MSRLKATQRFLAEATTGWRAGEARSALVRYAVAIATFLLAWGVRAALDPWLGNAEPFFTFYVAITLVVWWAGWRPAVVTLVLSYAVAHWYFLPPRHAFSLESFADVVEHFAYFFVAVMIVALMESQRRARRAAAASAARAEQALADLNEDMRKRQEAEHALRRSQQELAQANGNLERTVQERTASLHDAVRELQQFSYSLAHDLRAPLRAMRVYAQMLEEDLGPEGLPPPNADFLHRIQEAARRLDKLVTDSLDYSKIVHHDLPLRPVDLSGLLRGLIETYPNLQAHDGRIRVRPDMPLVLGNEAALTQCFANLLGNAVKFVPPGILPQVEVWAQPRADRVRVWVEDNGIGIPEDFMPHAFEMFQRGVTGYEGTGIGLAIVRKVAERMGGEAGVESVQGQGSRFWVDLRPAPVGYEAAPGPEGQIHARAA